MDETFTIKTQTSDACAYCRRVKKLTKEHIYPKFLYKKIRGRLSGFNEAADKVTLGERLIKDVCSTCNNNVLSKLDKYGEQYFQLNKLDHSFTNETSAEIYYEYDALLRWILKVSYNSFRTIKFAHNPFLNLIPYILTGQQRPKTKFVKLYIELIRGHKLTEYDRPKVAEQFQQTGYVPCHILAAGRLANGVGFHCRHFQINSHRFTLFIFPYRTKALDSKRFIQIFKTQFPFTEFVNPKVSKMKLRISARDIFEIHAGDHVPLHQRMKEREHHRKFLEGMRVSTKASCNGEGLAESEIIALS